MSIAPQAQRDAIAMLFLNLHSDELLASLAFAGLWLFPFGALVWKSGFLPKTLGGWLIINGVAWLAECLTGFLAPQYTDTVDMMTRPAQFGEPLIVLWLLIIGARKFGTRVNTH